MEKLNNTERLVSAIQDSSSKATRTDDRLKELKSAVEQAEDSDSHEVMTDLDIEGDDVRGLINITMEAEEADRLLCWLATVPEKLWVPFSSKEHHQGEIQYFSRGEEQPIFVVNRTFKTL